MPLSEGQTIDGKYRVGRLIGEGGMGTVYEGENVRIGRRVAIKVLHAQVAARPEFAARFEREARAAAKIGSPHICDVLDLGDLPDGERFIVMEFLDGVSLEARIAERGRLRGDELLPIAFEVLEALSTMHDVGIIHRDLKPANVFLAKSGRGRGEIVKVLDFGVSKFLPTPEDSGEMTATGMLMGTPLYMSPEQARGAREIDGRSDVYSASVIFYRALAGVLPFTADNFNELMFKIALEEPKPMRAVAPEVDKDLASIVHRGLAREPEARYASARAFQEEIVGWARKQGRASLSSFLGSESEQALVAAVDSLARAEKASDPKLGTTAAPGSSVASSRDGTPTAWSEDGPDPLAAAKAHDELAAAPTVPSSEPPAAPKEIAQTKVSAADEDAPEEARATSLAASSASAPAPADGARRRWMVPALASGAVAVGLAAVLGWSAAQPDTGTTGPTGIVATQAPPPGAEPPPQLATSEPVDTAAPPREAPEPADPDETEETASGASQATKDPPASKDVRATKAAVPAVKAHTTKHTTKTTTKSTKTPTKPKPTTTAPAPTTTSTGRIFRTHL